jgi:hypothetical protein
MAVVWKQTAGTVVSASGDSGSLDVGPNTVLAVDLNVTNVGGTGTPTMTLFLERLGADQVWYPVWSPSGITANGITSTTVGPGCSTNAIVTSTIRLRWVLTGTSPVFTFSASIVSRSQGGL